MEGLEKLVDRFLRTLDEHTRILNELNMKIITIEERERSMIDHEVRIRELEKRTTYWNFFAIIGTILGSAVAFLLAKYK